jgi:Rhs element Vgr protein
VLCRDKAFKLTLGRTNRTFTDMTDSDAIAQVIGEYGLTATVTATTIQHPSLLQYYATDWDFVLARAEANGMLVSSAAGTVTVAPPATDAAVLKVSYGIDLVRFDAELDARGQYASVEATSWDPATQAIVSVESAPEGEPAWGDLTGSDLSGVGALAAFRLQSPAGLDSPTLTALAEGRLARAALARRIGVARVQGTALAKPGARVELAGLGARFNGTAVIGRVEHRIAEGNWLTDIGLGLPAELRTERAGGVEAAAAAASVPPVRGLQIGVVLKVDGDPGNAHRVQVELPLQGAGTARVWARLGSPYATAGAGIVFRPEVSDEVVVGFLGDDPAAAVVLGALHSASHAPPDTAAAENYPKTLRTKAGLKIGFDDEKKSVTIVTPAANSVTLDDDGKAITLKDQHGNKVILDQSGITLDSPKDITIKAGGKVAVSATGNVEIAATGDATIEGLNVKATGQSTFAASGSAQTEVKSTGVLTLKGSLVQIN